MKQNPSEIHLIASLVLLGKRVSEEAVRVSWNAGVAATSWRFLIGEAIDFALRNSVRSPSISTGARTQHEDRILRRFYMESGGIIRKHCKY
jgi:hypothetical protein